jgi:hypothetical protein
MRGTTDPSLLALFASVVESGGVRDRCAQAVRDEDAKIRKLEGDMFGEGYRGEDDST